MSEAALISAFARIHSPLSGDPALLSLASSICSSFQLEASDLARSWDAYKFKHRQKIVTIEALNQLKKQLEQEFTESAKKKAKKQSSATAAAAAAAAAVAVGMAGGTVKAAGNSNVKRVYNKDNVNSLLTDLIGSGFLSAGTGSDRTSSSSPLNAWNERPIKVKKEVNWMPDPADFIGEDDEIGMGVAALSSPKSPINSPSLATESTTPTADQLPSSSSESSAANGGSNSAIASLFPLSETDLHGSSTIQTKATSSSIATPFISSLTAPSANLNRYNSRTDAGQIMATYNPSLASFPSSSSSFSLESSFLVPAGINPIRRIDIEPILTPQEIEELENKTPLRYMFMRDEDIQSYLLNRLEKMQNALMNTADYMQLVRRIKEESGDGEEQMKLKVEEKERKEKEERDKEKLAEFEEKEREKKERLLREEQERLNREKLKKDEKKQAADRSAARLALIDAETKAAAEMLLDDMNDDNQKKEGEEPKLSETNAQVMTETPIPPVLASSTSDSDIEMKGDTEETLKPVPDAVPVVSPILSPPPPVVVSVPLKKENEESNQPDNEWAETDDVGLSSLESRSQQAILVCGRVVMDANSEETRLCSQNVQIEGDEALSQGHRVNLRLGLVNSFSLFPGQVLLAKGISNGVSFIAESLVTSAVAPTYSLTYQQVETYNRGAFEEVPLTLISAAGPFTLPDDMTFTPLFDLLALVKLHRIDVLILQGPFVSEDNSNGLGYREVFEGLIKSLISRMANIHTQVLIQPSTRDMHILPIYPQPPFSFSFPLPSTFTLLPNPATIRINDLVIACTSLDVLTNMASSGCEYSKNPVPKDLTKLARLAKHLIDQQSFFPLYPDNPNSNVEQLAEPVCIDYSHASKLDMVWNPSLLLLPSKTQGFAREVREGTVVVNGNSLVKGMGGGTYVKVTLHSKSEEELKQDAAVIEGMTKSRRVKEHLINKRMRVDIVKI